jgi:predicted TPR repeat methyltransferase
MARSIFGVDLSSKMLDKARERGVYDQLEKADLSAFLNDRPDAFDLILAADVFIYAGKLEAVFGAVRRALRPNGLFVFSLEASNDDDIVIRPSRRYAHSATYIRSVAATHGFAERAIIDVAVRQEEEQDILGFIGVFGIRAEEMARDPARGD